MTVTIGQRVYRSHKPQTPGIVVADHGPIQIGRYDGSIYVSSFHTVSIKWVNGTVTQTTTACLKDFISLIEDHKRKVRTHMKSLDKLNALET